MGCARLPELHKGTLSYECHHYRISALWATVIMTFPYVIKFGVIFD